MLAITLLAIPVCALLLAFAAVMVYYHALFKKIQNAENSLSVSLGLFSISFLACIACEYFKVQSMYSFSAASEVLGVENYNIFIPGMILSTIADAVIKAGLATGAVIAVYCMYSSEKMTKRGAAMASSFFPTSTYSTQQSPLRWQDPPLLRRLLLCLISCRV